MNPSLSCSLSGVLVTASKARSLIRFCLISTNLSYNLRLGYLQNKPFRTNVVLKYQREPSTESGVGNVYSKERIFINERKALR